MALCNHRVACQKRRRRRCFARAQPEVSRGVRLSVRLSVMVVCSVKMNKHIFKTFSPSGSHTILVFPYQTLWQYTNVNPLIGASNAGEVAKNCDSLSVSGCFACCERFDHQSRCDVPWHVDYTSCWWHLSFMGDDNKVFLTRSLDFTPKSTEQHLIIRSGKSEATITDNKRLRSRYCTVEAN